MEGEAESEGCAVLKLGVGVAVVEEVVVGCDLVLFEGGVLSGGDGVWCFGHVADLWVGVSG